MATESTTAPDTAHLFRLLPAVDRLLDDPALQPLLEAYSRKLVKEAIDQDLESLRQAARDGTLTEDAVAPAAVARRLEAHLAERLQRYYRRVINGTGVILHTGLGRAPLAPSAVDALAGTAGHAQRVEIRLGTGQRGGRDLGCSRLLVELIGCEAAAVVNNNAAATLLILAALARGKKVLLSRGEMVEIGGSYRVPDIMEESGAVLQGVGTTNRTHERDYRNAIDEDTGMILKVHTSNYRVMGFTKEVDLPTLAALGREHGIPVVHDLGSGCLVDLHAHGRPGEELVQESVDAGADLVCFSGDKLLGGPQAGILAGKQPAVERCREHPLFRAMRPGRLIYTALEATLRLYQEGEERALEEIPALRRLMLGLPELEARAEALAESLRQTGLEGLEVSVVPCHSQAGSGSLPTREYESRAVQLSVAEGADLTIDTLATHLRTGDPAILTRAQDDALLLDVRTLDEEELGMIAARLGGVGG